MYSWSPNLSQISLKNSLGKVVFQIFAKIKMMWNENRLLPTILKRYKYFIFFPWNMVVIQGRSQTFQNEGAARGLRGEQGGWLGFKMAALHRPLHVQSVISFGGARGGAEFLPGGPPRPPSGYGRCEKKLSPEGGRKGGWRKKARAARPPDPGLEPGTCRVLGEGPQLHASGAV